MQVGDSRTPAIQEAAGTTRDYEITVATSPFVDGGTYNFVLDPAGQVTAWYVTQSEAESGGVDTAAVNRLIEAKAATSTPIQSAATGAVGTSTNYARADHRHQGDGGGGAGSGTDAEFDVADITVSSITLSVDTIQDWGDFSTLATLSITDDEPFLLDFENTPDFNRAPQSGGDRVVLWWQVVRKRTGESDVVIVSDHEYPRFVNVFAGEAAEYEWPSVHTFLCDDQVSGDTIELQGRMMRQTAETPLLTVSYSSANAKVKKITLSGGGGTSGGGLDQAAVDARIAPYARATPSGQIADAQIPSSIARDSELPTVPSPRSSAPLANQFGVSGQAGTSSQYARGDHRHSTPSAPSGGLNQSAVDARVQAYTGQTAAADEFPVSKMPENVQIVNNAVRSGGLRLWPDNTVQIAGDLQGTALASINTALTWTNNVTRSTGTATSADPWIQIRFAKSAYSTFPTIADLGNLVISDEISGDPDEPEPRFSIKTLTARTVAGDSTRWYAFAQLDASTFPASTNVLLRKETPLELNINVPYGDITGRPPAVDAGLHILHNGSSNGLYCYNFELVPGTGPAYCHRHRR